MATVTQSSSHVTEINERVNAIINREGNEVIDKAKAITALAQEVLTKSDLTKWERLSICEYVVSIVEPMIFDVRDGDENDAIKLMDDIVKLRAQVTSESNVQRFFDKASMVVLRNGLQLRKVAVTPDKYALYRAVLTSLSKKSTYTPEQLADKVSECINSSDIMVRQLLSDTYRGVENTGIYDRMSHGKVKYVDCRETIFHKKLDQPGLMWHIFDPEIYILSKLLGISIVCVSPTSDLSDQSQASKLYIFEESPGKFFALRPLDE